MIIECVNNNGIKYQNIMPYETFEYENSVYIKLSSKEAIKIGGMVEPFFNDVMVKPCVIEKISISK